MEQTPAPAQAPIHRTMSLKQAAGEVARQAEDRGDSDLARHASMVGASTAAPESWKEEVRRFAREWNIAEIAEPPLEHPLDRAMNELAKVQARFKNRVELPEAKDEFKEKLLSLRDFVDNWIREHGSGKNQPPSTEPRP